MVDDVITSVQPLGTRAIGNSVRGGRTTSCRFVAMGKILEKKLRNKMVILRRRNRRIVHGLLLSMSIVDEGGRDAENRLGIKVGCQVLSIKWLVVPDDARTT